MVSELLLVSSHPDDPSFLAGVAAVTGSQIKTAPGPAAAADLLGTRPFEGIFIDVSSLRLLRDLEMEVQKRYGLLGDQIQASRVHFIGDRSLDENRDVVQSPFFGSYFVRPPAASLEESAAFYGRMMKSNAGDGSRVIDSLLGEEGDVQSLVLHRSGQKQEAIEALRQYLLEAQIPARIGNAIGNSVDELIMNALFDAPTDDFGKPLYSFHARNQDRVLSPVEEVSIKIGFDGRRVVVSVLDQFGAIDRNRLLHHASISYRNHEYNPKQGGAGAGLGLAYILSTGASLVYHCETGKSTSAILVAEVFPNYREYKAQFQIFSVRFHG